MTKTYDTDHAREQMTLAAIAYVDKTSKDIGTIQCSIDKELTNEDYATKDHWTRVWGPVFGTYDDNLVYVAQHKTNATYSVVLRGTVDGKSWLEDIPTGQDPFPYITTGSPLVSKEFLKGVLGMVDQADSSRNTFAQFLENEASKCSNMRVYVTGHSQGGGLVSMVLAYLVSCIDTWTNSCTVDAVGYGFAAPSAGNADFANWFGQSDTATLHLVQNPFDIVPYGYGQLEDLKTNNIPCSPDLGDKILIDGAILVANDAGTWQQPETVAYLDGVQIPDPSAGGPSYLDQIGMQHNHNSYLWLLGATQTAVGTPTELPNYGSS